MISTLMFLQNALKHGPLPPLCQVDGWSAQSMLWDSMHNIFLGIGQDILGSGLQLLCSIKYFGDFSTPEQLKVAHRALREFYKRRHVQCGVAMFDQHTAHHMDGNKWYPSVEFSKAHHSKLVLFWLADEFYHASALGGEALLQSVFLLATGLTLPNMSGSIGVGWPESAQKFF